MTKEEVAKILATKKYQFAKSMPNIPHEYTVKKNWNNDSLFEKVVIFLRSQPKEHWRWGKYYRYFYANGYKYWTVIDDEPLKDTIIINRVPVK